MSTPNIKFELSPAESLAESFASTPGQQYSSLFHPQPSMEPLQALTPQSFDGDSLFGDDLSRSLGGSLAGTPAPEKKPVKKRKSWGQQLPEPKTNLPPRKRAKTEDEKEQRRVERVLRNRRAAQSSRERKRQEVEALEAEKRQIERRNNDLELQLANMATRCAELEKKLQDATGIHHGDLSPSFLPPASSTPSRQKTLNGQSPIVLTKDLFAGEQDPSMRQMMMTPQTLTDTHDVMQSVMSPTVNPSSLSSPLSSPPPMESTDESPFSAGSFVSTEETRPLDGFDTEFNDYSYSMGADQLGGYLNHPDSLGTDQDFFEQRVEPIADSFITEFNNLAGDNNGTANDFFFEDFIHHNPETTQSAPEVHSSDSLAEKTPSLQSQLGASSSGCDVGGNAVIV
ncbi:hypothetical protein DSL72_009155 [Monilinia vaccinii-corymbosi]|uniref:BZIP domain-containing protein n=1 Tax=Monilinia vaccinii-corymbosi TaxID=61207 RepID=A0A8A3PPX4_9HELO|nr:hypothetical protein DSL72_009155 [Monilinia vaccinii-corymbosi]